jgi:hypothetical protein
MSQVLAVFYGLDEAANSPDVQHRSVSVLTVANRA